MQLKSKNSEVAIIDLYDKYSSALYSLIKKITINEQIAEEILQKVFLKAGEKIPALNAGTNSQFVELLNLSRNEAIERLIEVNSGSAISITPNPIPEENFAGLQYLLKSLPRGEKTILSLTYYRQLTLHEIADLLKLPIKVVETIMQSALQKLHVKQSEPA